MGFFFVTISLGLEWNTSGQRFDMAVNPPSVPTGQYKFLSFSVALESWPERGWGFTGSLNALREDQDFTIEISDGAQSASIPVSQMQRILFGDWDGNSNVLAMQTVSLPLQQIADLGVNVQQINSIALVFDRRATGTLWFSDVQLCN